MPAEALQEDRLPLSWTDVGDLRKDDRMVALRKLLYHVTFDPARAIREHREAGRGPLCRHLLESPIENEFRDILRAFSEERDSERFGSSYVRQRAAVFAERERDEGRLEGSLHQPGPEHEPVLPILRLRADDVCAVRNLLEDLFLHFLVHRATPPTNGSAPNQGLRGGWVRPSI